ncbi:type II toxin-antitoxin system RelE/ParE family toxin [Bacteroides sp.]
MVRVTWYPDANNERLAVVAYSLQHFGRKVAQRIESTLDGNDILLSQNPNMGTIERRLDYLPETVRYLVIEDIYKEYYYVKNNEVRIVRLWHCAQNPENLYAYFNDNPHILCEPQVAYQPKKK